MRLILTIFLMGFSLVSMAQEESAEVDAAFPGGQIAMQEYISSSIKYPEKAIRRNWEGQIHVTFIVETDGSITNVIAMNGKKILRLEAERIVRSMPKWSPGMVAGTAVRTKCFLPINYRLEK